MPKRSDKDHAPKNKAAAKKKAAVKTVAAQEAPAQPTPLVPLGAADITALVTGRHPNPFSVLGIHGDADAALLRAFVPDAESLEAVDALGNVVAALTRIHSDGLFEGAIEGRPAYRLLARRGAESWTLGDPYAFGPVLGPMDDWLLGEGTHAHLYDRLGAHCMEHEGVRGTHFAVWAPNARRVSVVGDFNSWDGRRHVMRRRHGTGVWEIFVPDLGEGALYKFELIGRNGARLPLKSDPVGFAAELRPNTASVVCDVSRFRWNDDAWMQQRGEGEQRRKAMSTYEVHLGSWGRGEGNRWLTYDELADQLIPYATGMGFTHLELMPVSEHPFDGSWGYQPIGLFAPTSRHGSPEAFARFVDRCHVAGLAVIIDWVPGHFPSDAHGLARFDGTALYEHQDPRLGFHPDWNTLIYNFGRREVTNFLISNALFWLEVYHIDGLRVDAVASMLYLDYSRKEGEWIPNKHGGRENLEAVDFLKRLNEAVYARVPGAITLAEESTAWPGVSHPTYAGGLGFGFKWNMGWMHDSLKYMQEDALHRRWHHNKMTFGLIYAFAENFVLPLSHDEVVHGKGSLLNKMPGDTWRKFAQLRAYYGYMWAHPGKKLLFMGGEFAQRKEWDERHSLDWHLLDSDLHRGVQSVVRDCNHALRAHAALFANDCESDGFRWIVVDDRDRSVFAWLRMAGDDVPPVVCVTNMTPVPREGYRIGLPRTGRWREVLNTDAARYGGSGLGNGDAITAEPTPSHGFDASAVLLLPPLATLWFVHEG